MFSLFVKYLSILLAVFLFLISLTNAGRRNPEQFVVGGNTEDKFNVARYVVSIQSRRHIKEYFGYFHMCGGSIIGRNKILTAAHCLGFDELKLSAKDLVVVVGIRNRFKHISTTRIMHPSRLIKHKGFDIEKNKDLSNDIGLIILEEDIVFDGNMIAKIPLTDSPIAVHSQCVIAGWGRVFENGPLPAEINFAEVTIISTAECEEIYHDEFSRTVICAGGRSGQKTGSCTGDSGGPLICNDKVVGIVSAGRNCGDSNYAAMYTDVHQYLKWIRNDGNTLYLDRVISVISFILFMIV